MVSRIRIAVDVTPDMRRRVRMAAVRLDVSVQDYVCRALQRQVAEDDRDCLDLADDPVLTQLWDNDADAIYDKL